jgi:uncharacterized protein YunC (DUF1805 family)
MDSMKTKNIKLEKGQVIGYLIELGNAPLIIVQAKKGYVMCGYLNMDTANKLGDIAGKVTGVKTFNDIINAKIIEVSENAKKVGLYEGMNVKDFLNMLV